MNKPLRILYLAGTGNVIRTYQYWAKKEDDPFQISVTYSSQFFDVCHSLNAQAYVISLNTNKQVLQDGQFTIEHRPYSFPQNTAISYYLGQTWYFLQLIFTAIRFKADVVIISDRLNFLLLFLPWLGIKVIPSLHCVLWRKTTSLDQLNKISSEFNRIFLSQSCYSILAVSKDIAEQVKQITAGKPRPIYTFLPLYRQTEFVEVGEPDKNRSPFRVLFVGRIEKNKGVFDLLEIAKSFADEGRSDIKFDICGNGTQLESLKLAAKQAGVDSFFVCHGHCQKTQLREKFSQSHSVIVPTTTEFLEGFNKVVVEAILVGRPVITSSVCPALSYLHSAVVEVPPDDVQAYKDAILKLYDDEQFYEEKRNNCLKLQDTFYDSSNSWGAKLKTILSSI